MFRLLPKISNFSTAKQNLELCSLFSRFNNKNTSNLWFNKAIAVYFSDYSDVPNQGENPFKRTARIIKSDFKKIKREMNDLDGEYHADSIFPEHCDIVIIGGGIMGSSIAYFLQQRALDGLRVVVVEKDSSVKLNYNNSLEVGLNLLYYSCLTFIFSFYNLK